MTEFSCFKPVVGAGAMRGGMVVVVLLVMVAGAIGETFANALLLIGAGVMTGFVLVGCVVLEEEAVVFCSEPSKGRELRIASVEGNVEEGA
jgi:hypothetical protein